MHGVKRTRQTAEALEARRQKEAAKTTEYLALQEKVMDQKKAKSLNVDDFHLTTKLLRMNPELYTIWNYRRDILTCGIFATCSPPEINDYLSTDLQMTFSALKQHPKVYWIWNHRMWCLENTPDGPGDTEDWKRQNWAKELAVVEKMLDADSRNFHAWSYRRYVISSSPDSQVRSPTAELAYTKRKIEANFSNFSAWHQRSKILGSFWEKGERLEEKDAEFELLKPAMYMDHNDQSVWMYHRWLVGAGDDMQLLQREIKVIEELLELEQESKWCLESLVHYKRLLLRHQIPDEMRTGLTADCKAHLKHLRSVDPKRQQRYDELDASL